MKMYTKKKGGNVHLKKRGENVHVKKGEKMYT